MAEHSDLWIRVVDDEIIVSVPFCTYTATYYKRAHSSHLTLKYVSNDKDPQAPLTGAEFLGLAWDAANEKARELGWIV